MKNSDDTPELLYNFPPPTDDESWIQISERFTELRDYFENMRLETYEEAVNDTYPRWYDRELGFDVRAWNLLQYRKTDDRKNLESSLDAGRSLIKDVEISIENRKLSPLFLRQWGAFCECAGYVSAIYFADGHDLSKDQQALAGRENNNDAQLKWYLHFRAKLKNDDEFGVKEANTEIFKIVSRIASGEIAAVSPFTSEWFKTLMSEKAKDPKLKCSLLKPRDRFSSFIAKNTNILKEGRAKILFEQPFSEKIQIPSINLEDYY